MESTLDPAALPWLPLRPAPGGPILLPSGAAPSDAPAALGREEWIFPKIPRMSVRASFQSRLLPPRECGDDGISPDAGGNGGAWAETNHKAIVFPPPPAIPDLWAAWTARVQHGVPGLRPWHCGLPLFEKAAVPRRFHAYPASASHSSSMPRKWATSWTTVISICRSSSRTVWHIISRGSWKRRIMSG